MKSSHNTRVEPHPPVRLKPSEIDAIKQSVYTSDPHAKIYLFGSRADMNKTGGDIDLLVLSQTLQYEDKLRIKVRLFDLIEEQKVDIIIAKDTTDPFVRIALKQGIFISKDTADPFVRIALKQGIFIYEDSLQLLKQQLTLLDNAASVLKFSEEKCQVIGIKEEYTPDELDRFESLTSRFARLCDILLQKIFRLVDELDLEAQGTVRDRINRAEQKGLIKNAEQFIECRALRNDIAHEYVPENVLVIFQKVLEITPDLLESVETVKAYCEKYNEANTGG